MKRIKRKSSYIDDLGSANDAVGVDGPQVGKDVEEKVWNDVTFDDKRDDVGRAARVASHIFTKTSENHPIEKDEDPQGKMPADTGDEWIDVGNAKFTDDRDDIGRASKTDENTRVAEIVRIHLSADEDEDIDDADDDEDIDDASDDEDEDIDDASDDEDEDIDDASDDEDDDDMASVEIEDEHEDEDN